MFPSNIGTIAGSDPKEKIPPGKKPDPVPTFQKKTDPYPTLQKNYPTL